MNDSELRRLNFQELITLGVPDVDAYTFDQYRKNGYEHRPINGYCVSCEKQGLNISPEDERYRLSNISHGAHSSDFFRALKNAPDTSQWHQESVIFLYESPSLDYGIYREVEFLGYAKRPSRDWFWLHGDQDPVEYPARFRGGEYGGFVLSAISTFRLANVYITNLVKCGLNDKDGMFKGLGSYNEECVKNCYHTILSKELAIVQPKVIFAVGSAVADWLHHLPTGNAFIQQLPHPAGRRRGFLDEHYRALYFWLVVRALHKVGIIQSDEGSQLAIKYLEKYESEEYANR